MKGPVLMPAGQELMQWLRRGGKPELASRSFVWLCRWRAFWLEPSYAALRSQCRQAQDFPYPEGERLVFIQGFWRSGTTLLHEMLAALPRCAAPQTWQCMNPAAMLAPFAQPQSRQAVKRPMDSVQVAPDSPQEGEFALMVMGIPSLYRGFFDPRRFPELIPLMQQAYWTEKHSDWIENLEAFLYGIGKTAAQQHMILKSPGHLFRIRSLEKRFPLANHVWILRDPVAVWSSNLKMWRAMIQRYGLWNAPAGVLEEFLESALCAFADLLEETHNQGGFQRQPVYGYEALVQNPAKVFPSLVDRLNLGPWSEMPHDLQARLLSQPHAVLECKDPPADAPLSLLSRLHKLQETILAENALA